MLRYSQPASVQIANTLSSSSRNSIYESAQGLISERSIEYGIDKSTSDETANESDDLTQLSLFERYKLYAKKLQQQLLIQRLHPVIQWRAELQIQNSQRIKIQKKQVQEEQYRKLVEKEQTANETFILRKNLNIRRRNNSNAIRDMLYEQDCRDQVDNARMLLYTSFALAKHEKKLQENQRSLQEQKQLSLLEEAQDKANRKILDEQVQEESAKELSNIIAITEDIGRKAGMLPGIPKLPESNRKNLVEESAVLNLHPRKCSLRNINSNNINGEQKFTYLAIDAEKYHEIKTIRGHKITDIGMLELCKWLLKCPSDHIEEMEFGWNELKYVGIVGLADCLRSSSFAHLRCLDLRYNSVNCDCLDHILRAIASGNTPVLVELVLVGNILYDNGAKALSHACLKGSLCQLQKIDIRQNKIQNSGVLALWNVFTAACVRQFCPNLKILDIRRNNASAILTRSFFPCPPYLAF